MENHPSCDAVVLPMPGQVPSGRPEAGVVVEMQGVAVAGV